jgi:uncharacterized metal-binding protein
MIGMSDIETQNNSQSGVSGDGTHKDEQVPENAIFCCFGCMSSVGALTGVAVLEAYKQMDQKRNGLFCTSAIAAGVPKHRKSTEKAKRIIVVDGCYNKCARKILEKDGFKVDRYLNLLLDLKIPKIGPFKPFDYSADDLDKAVRAILKACEESG